MTYITLHGVFVCVQVCVLKGGLTDLLVSQSFDVLVQGEALQ